MLSRLKSSLKWLRQSVRRTFIRAEAPGLSPVIENRPTSTHAHTFRSPLTEQLAKGIQAALSDHSQKARFEGLDGEKAQCMVDCIHLILHEQDRLQTPDIDCLLTLLCKYSTLDSPIVPICIPFRGLTGFYTSESNLKDDGLGAMRVYSVAYKQEQLCIKTVKNECIEPLKRYMPDFIKRATIIHENLVPLYGVYALDNHPMCLVYPWIDWSLQEYITSAVPSLKKRTVFVDHILDGLRHLHHLGIVHGKLTNRNVLVSHHGKALLTDMYMEYEQANATAGFSATRGGETASTRWTAPDVLNGEERTVASDAWSFGCLLYYILSRKEPYYEISSNSRLVSAISIRGQLPVRPSEGEGGDPIVDVDWETITTLWTSDTTGRRYAWNALCEKRRMVSSAESPATGTAADVCRGSREFWAKGMDNDDFDLSVIDLHLARKLFDY